jgi:hypothetical protein
MSKFSRFVSDRRTNQNVSWSNELDWQAGERTNVEIVDGALVSQPDPPDSGVARWDFEQGLSDSWGSNHGSDYTSSGYTPGPAGGYAKIFNGSTDRVVVPHAPELQFTNSITISAWSYLDGRDDENSRIITKRTDGLTPESYGLVKDRFIDDDDSMTFRVYIDGEHSTLDSPEPIPLRVWTHWIATWDGTTQRLFKNGVEVGSQPLTGTIITNSDALGIGCRGDGNNDWWNGYIDDLRLYSKGLSPTEASNLYTAGRISG